MMHGIDIFLRLFVYGQDVEICTYSVCADGSRYALRSCIILDCMHSMHCTEKLPLFDILEKQKGAQPPLLNTTSSRF